MADALPQNMAPHQSPGELSETMRGIFDAIKAKGKEVWNFHGHVNNGVNSDGSLIEPDYPLAVKRRANPAYAPWSAMKEHLERFGFTKTQLTAASCHGGDNSFMKKSIAESDGMAAGVAFIDTYKDYKYDDAGKEISKTAKTEGDLRKELEELEAAGISGVRYSYVKRLMDPDEPKTVLAMSQLLDRMMEEGALKKKWHIDLYCEAGELPTLKPFLEQMPTPVVFDHMAVPEVYERYQEEIKGSDGKVAHKKGEFILQGGNNPVEGNPTYGADIIGSSGKVFHRKGDPIMKDGKPVLNDRGIDDKYFQLYLDLLKERPDFYAKVTCPERITHFSNKPEDWEHVLPFAQEIVKRFPKQVLFGTDWPHPNMKPGQLADDADLVNHWLYNMAGRKPETIEQIVADNPKELLEGKYVTRVQNRGRQQPEL